MEDSRPDAMDLRRFLEILRRRFWLMLAVVAVSCGAAFGLTKLQAKEYTATASLLLTDPAADEALVGTTPAQASDPQREAQTNLDVASLRTVAARTARRLARTPTADEVAATIHVDGNPDSNVLSVNAKAGTPTRAAALANGFAQEFINFTRDAASGKLLAAKALMKRKIDDLRARGKRGSLLDALVTKANDLQVRASLQSGNGQILQSATPPDAPSSPKPRRNLMIGGFAGLLLAIGAALALEQLDRRLRRPEDVEEGLDLPLLGEIPRSRALATRRKLLAELPAEEAEAFRMIRANVRYYALGRPLRSLLITSAGPDEGKTTLALYLAAAAAESGDRVLLVEADMRRPSLAEVLGSMPADGLSAVLVGDGSLATMVVRQPVAPHTNGTSVAAGFDVLLAGSSVPSPARISESAPMHALLRQAQAEYDLVVIDTPPVGAVSDAIPLVSRVDGLVVVARVGENTRDAIHRLRDRLEKLDAPAVGVVATFTDPGSARYGYGYGYSDGGRRRASRTHAVKA
jgi:capsular exopolysaccharide synthesis family protein